MRNKHPEIGVCHSVPRDDSSVPEYENCACSQFPWEFMGAVA